MEWKTLGLGTVAGKSPSKWPYSINVSAVWGRQDFGMCSSAEWIFKSNSRLAFLACAIVKMNPIPKNVTGNDSFNIKAAAQKTQILLVVAGTVLNLLLSLVSCHTMLFLSCLLRCFFQATWNCRVFRRTPGCLVFSLLVPFFDHDE